MHRYENFATKLWKKSVEKGHFFEIERVILAGVKGHPAGAPHSSGARGFTPPEPIGVTPLTVSLWCDSMHECSCASVLCDLHIAGAFLHGLLHSSSIALPPPCLTNSPCDFFWKSSITWMISPQLCVLLAIAYSLWLNMKKKNNSLGSQHSQILQP